MTTSDWVLFVILFGGVIGIGAAVVDRYIHAIVAALGAGVTTALWYGAVANAMDDG